MSEEIFAYVAEHPTGKFVGVCAPSVPKKDLKRWFGDMAEIKAVIKTVKTREEYENWLTALT